ncbi:hypothetical protein CS078_24725 [Pseudomonas prosekii]|jgi:hypothetical protein|uniref:Uncharacterized protein n=1 Tax=Pseudomonas prosekii TaxID=1148509 RepID=A0A3L8C8R8_9PSED|nr:hypothetical protein [Pseudomonas prosekii]RLU04650.1 hypothetical protein CS076_26090 [Pseudomonas prosekii]RLU05140.1 hypothetical protein CS078_24725 [Pseudomonas prosekii]
MTDPRFSNEKFPSEQQGGYDPIPTHPEPLSPGRTTVNPEDEPGIDELPNNEGAKPLEQSDGTDLDPERVREETDNAEHDNQINPR